MLLYPVQRQLESIWQRKQRALLGAAPAVRAEVGKRMDDIGREIGVS